MAYFTPMLQDKDLTMCQDVTPNTSEGRSMMYAITWNNAGTKMIQVGIEPKRLIDEMNQNQISAVISNMPMYTGINIFVADSGDGKILGSTKAAMVGKTLNDVGISRDKVTEQADVPAICYRNIDGIVSRCAFDRTDDYIVVVTCNLLSNIKTDVIIMVIMIVYFIIAAKALASMFTKLDRVRRSAYTDELTGCFNRKAYQENVEEYWKSPDMVYISMDVNGLKKVNDHQGHAAGDELLKGAVECMMKSFNGYGRVYRFGGDEFAAIVFADSRRLKKIIDDFKERMNKWSGKKVSDVSVSLGYAEKCERQWENFEELAEQADERMYACKAEYYSKKGEDRRKLQAAHNALTKLYTKVLIINLTQNSYQIVSIDRESLKNSVFSAKLSDWFATFANSDELYPDDRQAFLQKTALQNLKKNINGTGKSYSIIYRRKYGEEYKDTMMEILAAEDYTDDSQVCYLCVRCLG